jgi:hypothetical protein
MVGYLTNIYCPTVGHLIEKYQEGNNLATMPTTRFIQELQIIKKTHNSC